MKYFKHILWGASIAMVIAIVLDYVNTQRRYHELESWYMVASKGHSYDMFVEVIGSPGHVLDETYAEHVIYWPGEESKKGEIAKQALYSVRHRLIRKRFYSFGFDADGNLISKRIVSG